MVLGLGSILGTVALFYGDFIVAHKVGILIAWLTSSILFHFLVWNKSNNIEEIKLKINGCNIEIIKGDIFENRLDYNGKKPLKVFSFNEYFDTYMDENDTIIAANTLNGRFINEILKGQVKDLDKKIKNDINLCKNKLEINENRKLGKKQKYRLGSMIKYNKDYLLTAFSYFDEQNEAHMTLESYINFLMQFWLNVNSLYAQRSIELPIIGSGITRFNNDGNNVSSQELLEHIIWTFKISRLKFASDTVIRIVVWENSTDIINLYRIREMYKNEL
ncbi:MAG: macro domain-containing protein [Paraclostridium sordellii]